MISLRDRERLLERRAELSRDQVVARLRERVSQGIPVTAQALPRPLYRAILARFGSITAARQAAGLPASLPPRRRWSEATVVEELRRLHVLGLAIRDRDLKDAGHSGVVEAARLCCGGLTRARRLARIAAPRRAARDREMWDEQRVVEEILALQRDGASLAGSKVDPRLYLAARRYLGSWGGAIEAAGLAYEQVRLHAASVADEELLDELRALALARPELLASELEAHRLGYLLRARFPSLAAAALAAGLGDWPRRQRHGVASADEAVDAILARHARGGSLTRSEVRRDDRRLLRAAERQFGSWQQALAAAGVDGDARPCRREWTQEAVLAALEDRQAAGGSLAPRVVAAEDPALYSAVQRHFSSYFDAVRRFGVEPLREPWTPRRVVAELAEMLRRGESTRTADVRARRSSLERYAAKFFGSLAGAVDVARGQLDLADASPAL